MVGTANGKFGGLSTRPPRADAVRRTARLVRLLLRLSLVVCALLTFAVGRYLYLGTAAPGIPATASVRCAEGVQCNAMLQDLGNGRWRASISDHGGKPVILSLHATGEAVPHVLLVRRGFDRLGRATAGPLLFQYGATVIEAANSGSAVGPRQTIGLPDGNTAIDFTVQALDHADADKMMVVSEFGLFRSTADINRPFGLFQIASKHETKAERIVRALLLMTLALSLGIAVTGGTGARVWAAVGVGLGVACAGLAILTATNGPEWADDLRGMLAGGTLQEGPGSNLNYGMYMASSILDGHGPLIRGVVPWARMPGYGYFVALGFGDDLLHLGIRSIFLQLALLGVGLTTLALSLARLTGLVWAIAATAILAVAPAMSYYTFIEAAIPGVAYLTLAAACCVISEERSGGSMRLLPHLMLHAAFALWFSFRSDVLPGWAAVSILLYAWPPRRWRLALLPVMFCLVVGLSWAFFKQPRTGEFSMTTNSAGASFMVGLWDMPNPFDWVPNSDGTYFTWAKQNDVNPVSKAASDLALKEVVRFWVTYPIYMVALTWNKFMRLLFHQIVPGSPIFARVNMDMARVILSFVGYGLILLALCIRHRPRNVLLLGWIALFNTPVFFLTYNSSGRFYNTTALSLVAVAAFLLSDRSFYEKIVRKPLVSGTAVGIVLCVLFWGQPLANWMAHSDRFRFSVVLLDPGKSTLIKWKRPLQMSAEEAEPMPCRDPNLAAPAVASRSAAQSVAPWLPMPRCEHDFASAVPNPTALMRRVALAPFPLHRRTSPSRGPRMIASCRTELADARNMDGRDSVAVCRAIGTRPRT